MSLTIVTMEMDDFDEQERIINQQYIEQTGKFIPQSFSLIHLDKSYKHSFTTEDQTQEGAMIKEQTEDGDGYDQEEEEEKTN